VPRPSHRIPYEIFGCRVPSNRELAAFKLELTSRAKERYCPFTNKTCKKKHRTNGSQVFGVCSVIYGQEKVIICPERFNREKVLHDVAKSYFPKDTKKVIRFDEVAIAFFNDVQLKADHVLANETDLRNFIAVEIVAVDTTSTGKLYLAYKDAVIRGSYSSSKYGFGINWGNVIKRTIPQLIIKGAQLAALDKQTYVIIQRPTFEKIKTWLPSLSEERKGEVIFWVYDYNENGTTLELVEVISVSPQTLAEKLAQPKGRIDLQSLVKKFEQKLKTAPRIQLEDS